MMRRCVGDRLGGPQFEAHSSSSKYVGGVDLVPPNMVETGTAEEICQEAPVKVISPGSEISSDE
jgi:hypothetical protein